MQLKSVQNENGKTVVIILIVLAVVGYLVYPGTSPFKSDYYDLKAEQNLKDLHSTCKRYWAQGIAQQMVTKATGIKKVTVDCTVEAMVQDPFNFVKLEGMDIKILNGTKTGFQATGKHAEGATDYKINAEGKVKS